MKFTKMHGCGNDYIYINTIENEINDAPALARKVSDRHYGIGSDGLILIGTSACADFSMRMYNSDGSEAEMCGNGVRCIAKYVYDKGLTPKTELSLETKGGIKYLVLHLVDGAVETVTVDMGEPILPAAKIPVDLSALALTEYAYQEACSRVVDLPITVAGRGYHMTCLSVGNPHAVIFVPDTSSCNLEALGPLFEHHEAFPNLINTEFVQLLDRSTINMRVWERGSGETLACGTGTCASVMACILNGLTEDKVLVHLLGGDLTIEYSRENNHIYMTGPAVTVFEGELS